MTFNRSYDFYCYRAKVRDKTADLPISSKKTGFSQNIKEMDFDANDGSPAILKNKRNICQCRAQNWNSIVDHYNGENTTVVWKSGSPIAENPIENKRQLRINKNKGSYKVTTTNLKSNVTKDENKKHRNNNKVGSKEKKTDHRKNTEDLKNTEYTKLCQQGVCKINRKEGKEHRCKCKQDNQPQLTATCTNNSCKSYRMSNMTKSCMEFFCSLFKKQIIAQKEHKNTNPVFAIRVDSSSLNVLNPNETKTKVKKYGTLGKNDKCLCPSRLEKEKKYGIGETCSGGVCESARKGKYDKFDCHCAKTALIECCDSTCDNIKTTKGKQNKIANLRNLPKNNSPIKSNKPLFEMVLDNNHMNVLNTGEIYEVLRKASNSDMCPTGICRATANKNRILNCKCLSKKIAPILHECNKMTCQSNELTDKSKKKSKFYICTRICSSLQNWTCRKNRGDLINQENNVGIHKVLSKKEKQQLSYPAKQVKKIEIKHRKNVKDTGQGDAEFRIKKTHRQRKKPDSKPRRKPKKSKKIIKKRNLKIKRSFRKNTMSKKMREAEKEVSKAELRKEKLNIKIEKQKEKEAKKRKRKIEKMQNKEENKLNFLATFVIGIVNLSLQTIKGILTAVINIITSPTRSYIYAKHRIRDPIGTCKIFKSWFTTTWKARDTKISSIVQESNAIDILSDHFENSALFETFVNKGQTPQERQIYERNKKRRVRRIRKRNDQALHSCRHALLLTLRKHPCIWVYHICPFYYPQFLAMRQFVTNFLHLLVYLAALICWTPCIMCVEITRAFFCCIACAQ